MDLEEYVKREFAERKVWEIKMETKIDTFMEFMIKEKALAAKHNKLSAMIVGAIISVIISIASFYIEKKLDHIDTQQDRIEKKI